MRAVKRTSPLALCNSRTTNSQTPVETLEMPALPITFACGLYDRMLALYTGDVKPDGIDLNFVVLDNPREIFDRMTGRLEFDVCEMSSSEYISRFAAQK